MTKEGLWSLSTTRPSLFFKLSLSSPLDPLSRCFGKLLIPSHGDRGVGGKRGDCENSERKRGGGGNPVNGGRIFLSSGSKVKEKERILEITEKEVNPQSPREGWAPRQRDSYYRRGRHQDTRPYTTPVTGRVKVRDCRDNVDELT